MTHPAEFVTDNAAREALKEYFANVCKLSGRKITVVLLRSQKKNLRNKDASGDIQAYIKFDDVKSVKGIEGKLKHTGVLGFLNGIGNALSSAQLKYTLVDVCDCDIKHLHAFEDKETDSPVQDKGQSQSKGSKQLRKEVPQPPPAPKKLTTKLGLFSVERSTDGRAGTSEPPRLVEVVDVCDCFH